MVIGGQRFCGNSTIGLKTSDGKGVSKIVQNCVTSFMDDPLIVSGKHTGTDLMTARVSFSVESVTRTSPVATDVVKAIKKIAPRIRNRIFVTTDF